MTAASSSTASTAKHTGNPIGSQTYKIITQYGDMLAVKQGIQHHHHHHQQNSSQHAGGSHQEQQQQQQQTRPVIMTFHDLGLNSELQFARFCECDEVKLMLQTFTMIHVNFIGQEFPVNSQTAAAAAAAAEGSGGGYQASPDNTLPDDFKYPNVEQMAESIVDICTQLRVRSFIGLAVGAGAHVVSSLALMRPDLVDGLFLINPVVASCSITEWLYFKMSAIASNHRIGAGGSSSGGSSTGSSHGHHHSHNHNHHHHRSRQNHDGDSPKKKSGIRRLLHAAHIHLPHHHHLDNQTGSELKDSQQQPESGEASGSGQPAPSLAAYDEDTQSVGQISSHSSASSGSFKPGRLAGSSGKHSQSGSRLRRLILSRNFRLGGGHHSLTSAGSTASTSTSECRAPVPSLQHHPSRAEAAQHEQGHGSDQQPQEAQQASPSSSEAKRASSESLDDSPTSSTSSSPAASCCKRPPFEYLMYHHFGPASFQRYRRSSDTPILLQGGPVDSAGCSSTDSPPMTRRSGRGSGDSCSSNSGGGGSPGSSPPTTWTSVRGRGAGKRGGERGGSAGADNCSRSHDSLAPKTSRGRSGSSCMGANYLASFASDRQRSAYMQSVYRHYFCQINPHNLWLFAQSFAKRRTLNLRKDCGAAAHAAAAAAALGTSICTAFVGIGPVNSCAAAAGGDARLARAKEAACAAGSQSSPTPVAVATGGDEQTSVGGSAPTAANCQQQPAQALVAGTKVKRTFTCQTLIMCSSVQMHCERAFKLMSLLNPLQATWIKTEHLLVLEERPDKVCQALRLFLQGIGYSMSTYERRLRLNSANGSAGSADSNGSARSLL